MMPWFRANMTAWLYEYAKKHMSKYSRVCTLFQLDIGPEAFKRVFVTHRKAETTAVKKTVGIIDCEGKGREDLLREDLEMNVTLCLHKSFCRSKETAVDPLTCCKQRVEEQNSWRTAYNSIRMATDVLVDTETESAESMSQGEEMNS